MTFVEVGKLGGILSMAYRFVMPSLRQRNDSRFKGGELVMPHPIPFSNVPKTKQREPEVIIRLHEVNAI